MKCPKCGSTEMRRSRHKKWTDVLHALVGKRAFRCRGCRARFYEHAPPNARNLNLRARLRNHREEKRGPSALRYRLFEAAVFALLLGLFLAVLHFLTRESPPFAP
jgi:hypothetical protein